MSINNYGPPALGDVGAYQVSGRPFFKGGLAAISTVQVIEFPTVTNWVWIQNNRTSYAGDGPKIAFSENGFDTNNYFVPHSSPSVSDADCEILYVKVSRLYYKSSSGGTEGFDVVAGLTSIPTENIQDNWSGSAGVG
tara:strand:- start:30 stop:440 length:411 start_codon:yes stop_codon:yes gene_type:complete